MKKSVHNTPDCRNVCTGVGFVWALRQFGCAMRTLVFAARAPCGINLKIALSLIINYSGKVRTLNIR